MGTFLGAQAFAYPGVDLLLLDPVVERLGHAADLGGYRFNASPKGGVLAPVFLHHAYGTFADLGRKTVGLLAVHGSIFSE